MGQRKKHRTHLKAVPAESAAANSVPKSFVIKHGQVGSSITQLVRDVRRVLEPNTATRLKERSRNKLKDYLTMAPALQVTHLLAFTLTPIAPSLRIVRLPAGPTLSYRIERYSLAKDILNTSKRTRSIGLEYLTPPLLVLASFPPPSPTTPAHLSLVMKSFQSLFPPLSPKTTSLSAARRVVLVSYNSERGTIDVRHYVITVKPFGVSKRVRRLVEGASASAHANPSSSTGTLDLGREKDVADFLLRKRGEPGPEGGGYESAASSAGSVAGDDGDTVSLADDYVGRNNRKGQKKAVRLDEVGPRLELRLVKITEGPPGKEGAVLYHEFVKKTKKEVAALKTSHAERERVRKARREEQEKNVARKKALAADTSAKGGAAGNEESSEEEKEGGWDEEEEISEGEESAEEDEDEDEEEEPRPTKKVKTRHKPKH